MSIDKNELKQVDGLFNYIQGLKSNGQSLRMYESNYKELNIYKQVSSRYNIYTGISLNKKPNIIYFIESSKRNFKTLEDLLNYIDNH